MAPGESLTAVLRQAAHVKDLVEQSALELSLVNDGLAQEMAHAPDASGVGVALQKFQAVETKVQDAAGKLSVMNLVIEAELAARQALRRIETPTA